MGNFNKVLLLGNLCQDPEVKYSTNGNAFAQVGMATNRKWTDKDTGEVKEEVCFVDVKAFGRTAEIMGEYLQKGSPVFIEGRLSYYRWDDEQGNPHSKHSVVVESLQMLGKNGNEQTQPVDEKPEAEGESPDRPPGGQSADTATAPVPQADAQAVEAIEAEEEIPFS